MRFGIFGDIHGNLEALESVLEDMQVQAITHTACVGDIVGQYANPRECLEIVRALGCPIVKGNQDMEVAEASEFTHLNDRARSAIISTRPPLTKEQCEFLRAQPLQRLVNSFTLVHSSLHRPVRWNYVLSVAEAESSFQHQEADVCFFGHTHIPHAFIRDTEVHRFFYKKLTIQPGMKYFINVGSVGEPRDGDWRAAYLVYDLDANTIELRRLPFDLRKARHKLG